MTNANLKEVAFKNPASGKAVIVVTNPTTSGLTSAVSGLTASNTKIYQTSATENMAQLSDQTVSSGLIALTFPAESITTIVEDISETQAPASVSNLSASSLSSGVKLSWTAPGSSGSLGTANKYEIRRSSSMITAGNWSSATVVTGPPAPLNADAAQNYLITGLG